MKELKLNQEQIIFEKNIIKNKIEKLPKNDIVKQYLDLCIKNDELTKKEEKIYKQIKMNEYKLCEHIWVNTFSWQGRSYNYTGCIKCGLNKRALYLVGKYSDKDWLDLDDKIMYEVFESQSYNPGINSNIYCDLDLAKAIYKKLIEIHPNIDDETIVKYLKVAINNIRKNSVSDERKENRAKRLSLKPNFNRWYEKIVCNK